MPSAILISPTPHAITELVGLSRHGSAFLTARIRSAQTALRERQQQMATDRASRYRADVGTHFLDRLAFKIVVGSYPQGRRFGLATCLRLRADIAAARRALAEWDADTAVGGAPAGRNFLMAAE